MAWNIRVICEELDQVNSELYEIAKDLEKFEQPELASLTQVCSHFVEVIFCLTSKIK